MRVTAVIILAVLLNTCAVVHPGAQDSKDRSARRADPGKYILEETRTAGSRQLFTPPGAFNCLNSSRAVSNYIRDQFKDRGTYGLTILVLDGKNQVLQLESVGEPEGPELERILSTIQALAVLPDAASFILVQYHPTRTSSPHEPGLNLARATKSLLADHEAPLLDYVIINRESCFSFADHSLL